MLESMRRLLAILGRFELVVAMGAFWAVLGLVVAQVLARQVDYSMWWAQEWTELLIMYAYFLGTSFIYQARQMVIMEFLIGRSSLRARLGWYVFSQLLVILFCSVVAVAAIRIARQELDFPSFVIEVPRFFWTLPLIVGSISMILTSIYFALAVVRAAKDCPPDISLADLEERTAIVPPERRFATIG